MPRYRTKKSRSRKLMTIGILAAVGLAGVWSMARLRADLISDAAQVTSGRKPKPAATAPASQPLSFTEALSFDDIDIASPTERREKIDALFAAADTAFEAGQYVQCRTHLNEALAILGQESQAVPLRDTLAAMNEQVFLGPDIHPGDPYEGLVNLLDGDNFPKLAARYRVPAALLQKVNPQLDPRNLRGSVKVIRGPFHLTYNKHAQRLDLYVRDLYVKSFSARIEQASTMPVGEFKVKAGGKVQAGGRQWIAFTGENGGGWLYGSGGPRTGKESGMGILLGDEDLQTLYNVLVEGDSLLHVEP